MKNMCNLSKRSYDINYKLWGKFITRGYEKYVQFL